MVVEEELREDEEALLEELVREVDRRVHDADAVDADAVGDVLDPDRVQILHLLAARLDEHLVVQVVPVVGHEDPDEVVDVFEAAVWQPGTVDDEDKLREIFLGTLQTIQRLRMPSGMKGSEPIEQLWDDEPDPAPAQNSEDSNLPTSSLTESINDRNMHRMYKKWRTFIK